MKILSVIGCVFARRLMPAASAVFIFLPALFAADLPKSLPQYSSHFWQTEEGLPHNSVQAITQTSDGYLWAGTRDGLARFDGVRFTVLNSPIISALKSHSFTALCTSRNGALWAGTEGGGLIQWQEGRLLHYSQANGLGSDNVKAICQTK